MSDNDFDQNTTEGFMHQIMHRLGRIETHIDEMRKVMQQIGRTEERVATALHQNKAINEKIEKLQERILVLEKDNVLQGKSLSLIERIGWLVITTVAGIAAYFVRGF